MITIAKFNNPVEAQIVKGQLEAAGIPCFLRNENVSQVMPFLEVELQVLEEDVEQARALIAD